MQVSKGAILRARNASTRFYVRLSFFLRAHANLLFFLAGSLLLFGGLHDIARAQDLGNIDDGNITKAVGQLFRLIEGSFGALIATAAGIGAIIASAVGGFKAAWGFLACSVGAFILRSLISLFFGEFPGKGGGGIGTGGNMPPGTVPGIDYNGSAPHSNVA